jgi:hypothetical protein
MMVGRRPPLMIGVYRSAQPGTVACNDCCSGTADGQMLMVVSTQPSWAGFPAARCLPPNAVFTGTAPPLRPDRPVRRADPASRCRAAAHRCSRSRRRHRQSRSSSAATRRPGACRVRPSPPRHGQKLPSVTPAAMPPRPSDPPPGNGLSCRHAPPLRLDRPQRPPCRSCVTVPGGSSSVLTVSAPPGACRG